MDPKLKKFLRAVAILSFFLILFSAPGIIPILIFGALIYFSLSGSGKKFFDPERWKDGKGPIDISAFQSFSSRSSTPPPPSPKKTTPGNILSDIQNLFSEKPPKNSSPLTPSPMNSFSSSSLILGLLILFGGSVLLDGFVSVPAGSVAVIFDRGQGVINTPLPEGIHLKIPFWQTATIVNTRLQEMSILVQDKSTEPINALTKDGQQVNIDATVQYYITTTDAPNLFQQIGLDYEQKIITPGVRSVVREIITGYDSKELFAQEKREEAVHQIRERLRANYAEKFITLKDILIRNVEFSDNYLKSIEEKKIAEQKVQRAEFEQQEAKVRKETTIIEAQAQAESIRLKGDALHNNPEVIQLQFVDKLAPNVSWGILPDGAVPLIDPSKMGAATVKK
ncbi:MAG: prohibitin family protein [Candidatus Peregrinibacteria bacterium]